MPRKYNIKWRKSDAEKLDKEIKRFNAKVRRTQKAHPEIASLQPELITREKKKEMKENLQNLPRSEFNKQLHSLERYSVKGAEKPITSKTGNTVTHYQKREVGIKVATINRERKRELTAIQNIDATSRGESIGLKRGEMGSERLNSLKPKKYDFDKIKGGKEWELFVKSIDKQASNQNREIKAEQYKKNYLDAMERVYGEYARELIDIIKELPAETVVETYFTEQEADIDFHYSPEEMNTKLEILDNIWQGVYSNYLDETDG